MTQSVALLEGNTFVVSDRAGDIIATRTDPQGLFERDMRFLSRWVLSVDGVRPSLLSFDATSYFSARFFLAPSSGTVYVDAPLSIIRSRSVGEGFHEDIVVLSASSEPIDLELRIEAAADFADLFEVKDALEKRGELYHHVEDERLVLGYRRGRFVRETWISATAREVQLDPTGLTFRLRIDPHGTWTTCIEAIAAVVGRGKRRARPRHAHGESEARPEIDGSLDRWLDEAPKLSSSWDELPRIYHRCLVDLAALRFHSNVVPGALPAAGLPWFMAIFGRDSILTSYQALPFVPELARTTLETLALLQGTRVDDFRDEEPGKIMHELRLGEMTAFEERPHSPYYGSADATPLFLVLLDEYERWTGDLELVRALERPARAALEWIDRFGDRDADGYVEYERRNAETGLENQCWKDSWNSILFADGRLASLPRATCEIQGYVYDAKVRAARLARCAWDDVALAERLEREAAELKARFNRDFWLADRGYFALALDGDKQPVDSLTSNIGHLLFSGIVDDDKASAVAAHLMGERLFSGWGVRTMAEGDGGYNPLGYHVGTVWPHDTSFIAAGLRRYGFHHEAARMALAMLEAAVVFEGRLPEAMAGYARALTRFPVEYPTACSPQAWATGTPLLLLRVLLGLEPFGEHLVMTPAIPSAIERIELLAIPGRWGRADAFGRGLIDDKAA
jgi:glycogen debranching enzyme